MPRRTEFASSTQANVNGPAAAGPDGHAPRSRRTRRGAKSKSNGGAGRNAVPTPVAKRLSLYLRQAEELAEAGQRTVSSRDLGATLGYTDAQVRKDLGHFGQFGQPGIGYDVAQLAAQLRRVLGTDRTYPVCLVGVGNLGRALLAHGGFKRKGCDIVVAFDNHPGVIGLTIHGCRVHPMEDVPRLIAERGIRFAILAVPGAAAQGVCDRLVAAGVAGLLNFAPKRLQVPEGVRVVSVDLALQLEQLAFQVHLTEQTPA